METETKAGNLFLIKRKFCRTAKSLETQFMENKKEEESKNECATFVLAKKYLDYDSLLDDNEKDIIDTEVHIYNGYYNFNDKQNKICKENIIDF